MSCHPMFQSANWGHLHSLLGEIYQYVVMGENYSLTELREIQDWLIAPQLKVVSGVTEINSFGGFVKQYDVVIQPGKLRTFGISLSEVLDAIATTTAYRAETSLNTTTNNILSEGLDR